MVYVNTQQGGSVSNILFYNYVRYLTNVHTCVARQRSVYSQCSWLHPKNIPSLNLYISTVPSMKLTCSGWSLFSFFDKVCFTLIQYVMIYFPELLVAVGIVCVLQWKCDVNVVTPLDWLSGGRTCMQEIFANKQKGMHLLSDTQVSLCKSYMFLSHYHISFPLPLT